MWKLNFPATAVIAALALSSAAHADSANVLVGAGIGAVIGHQIDHRHGAIIGGVIGAVAGSAMEQQQPNSRYYGQTHLPPQNYQPVHSQAVVYYPVQPMRVVYQPVYRDKHSRHWRHDKRAWKEQRRAYRNGYHQGYRDARWDEDRWDD